jgi:hypothetical protein
VKIVALFFVSLLVFGCSGGGGAANLGKGGHAGGQSGAMGSGGHGGTGTMVGGSSGGGDDVGTGGQTGGTPGGDGVGGRGAGGTAGMAGQGGTNGNAEACDQLESDYFAAFRRALMCHANSSAEQCTHLVDASLTCRCQGWVTDTSELDAIRADWTAAGCTPKLCTALCPAAGEHAVCTAVNSGDLCTPVITATN